MAWVALVSATPSLSRLSVHDLPVERYGFSSAPLAPWRTSSAARKPVATRVRTWCRTVPGSLPSRSASCLLVRAWSRQSRRMRRRSGLASALASAGVAGRRSVARKAGRSVSMGKILSIDFSKSMG